MSAAVSYRHLLEVRDLETEFHTDFGIVRAVDGVDLHIDEGETVGLVGESGCGKSVAALSIVRLVPDPPGRIVNGQVLFEGEDLLQLGLRDMRHIRGAKIGIIFQEPLTSLNPVLSIERQLAEPLQEHLGMTRRQASARASELLDMVGIPDPTLRLRDYPHMMSGGQRQRIMIAIALSCNPRLLIADEATTALDVTIQAQILELMKDLTEQFGTALLMITHNLGVVARYADRVCVMYAGKIREMGPSEELYGNPKHPYTLGLLGSVPRLDMQREAGKLTQIPGDVPDPTRMPSGCAFHPRCEYAVVRCAEDDPGMESVGDGHVAACWESERVGRNESQKVST
ncbi:MAG: ABC transporter ATP-binding protein [Chloroflexi bacterium]|nr:ABC transporter ATP-binding protein [Chloroflexota bacterium]